MLESLDAAAKYALCMHACAASPAEHKSVSSVHRDNTVAHVAKCNTRAESIEMDERPTLEAGNQKIMGGSQGEEARASCQLPEPIAEKKHPLI